jgi:hypothetical protein
MKLWHPKFANSCSSAYLSSSTNGLKLGFFSLLNGSRTHRKSWERWRGFNLIVLVRNFVVKPVRQLVLTKILSFQGKRISKRLEASAAAQRAGRLGALILYVATSTQVDMYEYVASDTSLVETLTGNLEWRIHSARRYSRSRK